MGNDYTIVIIFTRKVFFSRFISLIYLQVNSWKNQFFYNFDGNFIKIILNDGLKNNLTFNTNGSPMNPWKVQLSNTIWAAFFFENIFAQKRYFTDAITELVVFFVVSWNGKVSPIFFKRFFRSSFFPIWNIFDRMLVFFFHTFFHLLHLHLLWAAGVLRLLAFSICLNLRLVRFQNHHNENGKKTRQSHDKAKLW